MGCFELDWVKEAKANLVGPRTTTYCWAQTSLSDALSMLWKVVPNGQEYKKKEILFQKVHKHNFFQDYFSALKTKRQNAAGQGYLCLMATAFSRSLNWWVADLQEGYLVGWADRRIQFRLFLAFSLTNIFENSELTCNFFSEKTAGENQDL